MKELTTHWDGHGLNERIIVRAADEPGPGGAYHLYEFGTRVPFPEQPGLDCEVGICYLQFQRGPRDSEGSTPGVTEGAVLAALIDRLTDFQNGEFPSPEGAEVLEHLEKALWLTKERAHDRAARGVLGKNKP